MKSFDQWPPSLRIVLTNAVAAAGIFLGLTFSNVKPSASVQVYIAVFIMAFMNLMFLVVRPRLVALRTSGQRPHPYRTLIEVLKERPLITVLCILQLLAACRATATTILIIQTATSDYVRAMAHPDIMIRKLAFSSILMAGDSVLWYLSSIGLWRTRIWAWWLALVLNLLAAIVSLLVQVAALNQFLFDPLAALTLLLLLVPTVRKYFQGSKATIEHAAI